MPWTICYIYPAENPIRSGYESSPEFDPYVYNIIKIRASKYAKFGRQMEITFLSLNYSYMYILILVIFFWEDRTWLVEIVLFTNCRTSTLPRCMIQRFINKQQLLQDKILNLTNKMEKEISHCRKSSEIEKQQKEPKSTPNT